VLDEPDSLFDSSDSSQTMIDEPSATEIRNLASAMEQEREKKWGRWWTEEDAEVNPSITDVLQGTSQNG
jgi:hypothetical protein